MCEKEKMKTTRGEGYSLRPEGWVGINKTGRK